MRILAIVPAYNEAGNIEKTINDIRQHASHVEVLVINDGSSDDTATYAKKTGAHVVTLPFNLGIGGAVQTGMLFAYEHHYDYALQIDGDGQHDARYIKDLLAVLTQESVDMVVGSRFLQANDGFKSSFSRRLGINFFVYLINGLTGVVIKDPTSGFRAFNKKAIRIFAHDYPTDFPEPEAIVIAHRSGLMIKEIPVLMRSRESGASSIRKLKSIYYMLKVTLAILLLMLRRVPKA